MYTVTCAVFTWYLAVQTFLRYKTKKLSDLYEQPESWTVLITRMICAIIFHFSAMNIVLSSVTNIKYLSKHPTHFTTNKLWPLIAMFVRIITAIFVELIQVLVLVTLKSHFDCITSFMAMETILNFEQLFFIVLREKAQ